MLRFFSIENYLAFISKCGSILLRRCVMDQKAEIQQCGFCYSAHFRIIDTQHEDGWIIECIQCNERLQLGGVFYFAIQIRPYSYERLSMNN